MFTKNSPVHNINHLQLFFQRIFPSVFVWIKDIPIYFRALIFVYIHFALRANTAQTKPLPYL